jgi:DNA-binding XRE family transcriptional regulator/desulfoferrodoxin (superoxide reductase-like protein)
MMQSNNVGNLIRSLRLEQKITQKQLADKMNISDKTVSKWERGLGLPDISLISELSKLLGVDLQSLLDGEVAPNDFVNGNMRNTKYFVCPKCHNITLCTGTAEVSCCGKKLVALKLQKAEEQEKLNVEIVENEWFISSDHPMTKTHYISFVAFVTGERIQLIKQYPEWNLNVRVLKRSHEMLIWYCTEHGLFYQIL